MVWIGPQSESTHELSESRAASSRSGPLGATRARLHADALRTAAPALILLLACAGAEPAAAVTRRVPSEYPAIRAALTAASDGDVVLVAPGTYNEALDVYLGTLVSEAGPSQTVIASSGAGHQGATIVAASQTTTSKTAIRGFTMRGDSTCGVLCLGSVPNLIIENNVITGNGTGVIIQGSHAEIRKNMIMDNQVAVFATPDPNLTALITGNLVLRNGSAGILVPAFVHVSTNTVVRNGLAQSGGAGISGGRTYNNIVALNRVGMKGIAIGACNDVYSNDESNYSMMAPLTGDISVDPLFCDPASDNYTLAAISPCAYQNSAVCGQRGAFGVGCAATDVTRSSWGSLKARYR